MKSKKTASSFLGQLAARVGKTIRIVPVADYGDTTGILLVVGRDYLTIKANQNDGPVNRTFQLCNISHFE